MKRRLIFLTLLVSGVAWSQTVTRAFSGSTATRAADFPNISLSNPVTSWSLTFYLQPGLTAATFELDCAADNSGAPGSYSICPSSAAAAGTTNPVTVNAAPFSGNIQITLYTPHIAINPTSLTGTGIWSAVLTGRFGTADSVSTNGIINCPNTAVYDTNSNGATQLVALTTGQTVYVCGFSFANSTTSLVHVSLEYGTGTACATGATNITPAYGLQAITSSGPAGIVVGAPTGSTGLKTIVSNELCLLTDAAVSVQALVWYIKF